MKMNWISIACSICWIVLAVLAIVRPASNYRLLFVMSAFTLAAENLLIGMIPVIKNHGGKEE